MNVTVSDIHRIEHGFNLPEIEVISLAISLLGVRVDLPFSRIRFTLESDSFNLLFSLENAIDSPFSVKGNSLFIAETMTSYKVSGIVEDRCEVIYTRKDGAVISFNPNNRSSCTGCLFCYQPASNDPKKINADSIVSFFQEWMKKESLDSLSHVEQLALVTGCYREEDEAVDYIRSMRSALSTLGFDKEILYLGIIKNLENLRKLSVVKPFHLCFTVECFENRSKMLRNTKQVSLQELIRILDYSSNLGIDTSISYIAGLDTLDSVEKYFSVFKDHINHFPLVSVFQTDKRRKPFRIPEAESIDYYFKVRKMVQDVFKDTLMSPNSWNNYRSLWRTCYGDSNAPI